jgi:hypothetical protein
MPRLDIDLVANVARLQTDMAKAVGLVDKGFRDMKRAGDQVRNLLGALGVGFGAAQFASFIKSQIDAADALQDLSKRISISVGDLAGLKLVAQQSGTDLESLATAIKKLEVNMVNASTNKELAATFRILGVTAKDPTQALYQLANAFKSLGDSPERTAAAIKLMGKTGDAAIPALAAGGEELRRMMERGRELSGVTAENAKRADEFNDKLAEMKTAVGSAGLAIGTEMIPSLLKMTKEMERAIRVSGGFSASLQNAFILNFNPQFFGITNDLAALQEKLEKGILTPKAREAVKAQIEFLKEQLAGSREALERQRKDLDAIFREDTGATFGKAAGITPQFKVSGGIPQSGAPTQEVDKERLRLVAQFDELSKQVATIHKSSLDEQTKLAEKYVLDYQTLNRARAAGVIETDRQLGIERLAIATQYEQDLAEIAVKQDTGSKLAESLAAEKALRQQDLESRLIGVQDSLKSEQQLEDEDYARKLATLTESNNTIIAATEEMNAYKLLSDDSYHKAAEQLELEHRAKLGNIQAQAELARLRFSKMTFDQQLATASQGFGALATLMQSKHKAMFEIGKLGAIAQATIATRKGAIEAYAALAGIPIVGPFLGAAAAVALTLFGAEQIAAINSTSFGGGGAAGATPTVSVNPNTGMPGGTPGGDVGLSPPEPTTTIQVNIHGNVLGNEEFVRETLIPIFRSEINNRDIVFINSDSRQARELVSA